MENNLPTRTERKQGPESLVQKQASLLQLLHILQAAGIEPNQCGFGADSLLGLVAVEGSLELVKALVAAGADPNWRCDERDQLPLEEARKAKARAERFRRDTTHFEPIIAYLESVTD